MDWSIEFLNADVKGELDVLPVDIRAKFESVVKLIQAFGLERARDPHIRHLEGPLWEMGSRARTGSLGHSM